MLLSSLVYTVVLGKVTSLHIPPFERNRLLDMFMENKPLYISNPHHLICDIELEHRMSVIVLKWLFWV